MQMIVEYRVISVTNPRRQSPAHPHHLLSSSSIALLFRFDCSLLGLSQLRILRIYIMVMGTGMLPKTEHMTVIITMSLLEH